MSTGNRAVDYLNSRTITEAMAAFFPCQHCGQPYLDHHDFDTHKCLFGPSVWKSIRLDAATQEDIMRAQYRAYRFGQSVEFDDRMMEISSAIMDMCKHTAIDGEKSMWQPDGDVYERCRYCRLSRVAPEER